MTNLQALSLAGHRVSIKFFPGADVGGAFSEVEMLDGVVSSIIQPGDVAVDVGAHVGLWSIPLALTVGEGGYVYSFEPDTRASVFLRQNIANNDVNNISVFEVGLSDKKSIQPFLIRSDPELSSFHHKSVGSELDGEINRVDVPLERLDEFAISNSLRRPNFIKIDVEGHEVDVIQGFSGCSECLRAMIVEVHPRVLYSRGISDLALKYAISSIGLSKITKIGECHLLAEVDAVI